MNSVAMRLDDGSSEDERSLSTDDNLSVRSDAYRRREEEKTIRENLIKQEEKAVRTARLFVILTVLAMTIAVSVSVYYFASASDQHSFEIAYYGFVEDIKALVQWEVQYNFALVTQLANTILSATAMMNVSFPNVTIHDFETIGGFVDGMGGIMSAALVPLIKSEDIPMWEEYSIQNQGWIQTSKHLKEIEQFHQDGLHGTIQDHEHDRRLQDEKISPVLYSWENGSKVGVTTSPGQLHAPLWQLTPPDVESVNLDILQDPFVANLFNQVQSMNRSVLSRATPITDMFGYLFDPEEEYLKPNPFAFILQPVFDTYEANKTMVALLISVTSYENLLDKLLPDGSSGIIAVIRDGCGTDLSYVLNGREASFLGYGDYHDPSYDSYIVNTTMELYPNVTDDVCLHTLELYPTIVLQESYKTNKPAVYTSIVVLAFVFTSILLIVYDRMVTRRQEKTMVSAIRSGKLVASLFPSTVVDRVMDDANTEEANKKPSMMSETSRQATSIDSGDDQVGFFKTRPIADFFPQCTIIFADIAGFTSWASTRQPHQVFTLLETLYGSLDRIAKSRKIFKVETVGDCYVAVSGLPKPCKDHASVIARFARDCHVTIRDVTLTLEVSLGPDTADLAFRIGVHSGCVTGGVLRGDNARFQLFGDTMNTASRIESTGEKGKTQLSKATADLLIKAGKSHWIERRLDAVYAKGKGELETYWLTLPTSGTGSTKSGSMDDTTEAESTTAFDFDASSRSDDPVPKSDTWEKDRRIVDWNVAVLEGRLKAVVAKRRSTEASTIILDQQVILELHQYVLGIAFMYNKNPFHNFLHASHVTMAVTKMLSRVVAEDGSSSSYAKGITDDPLTQFAVVFSALVHDVDHLGVPNSRLVEESSSLAKLYNNKSVAENNSIDVALKFFQQPDFKALRSCLCRDQSEWRRFEGLIRLIVLATDIMDKDLKADRNDRWAKVFGGESAKTPTTETDRLKATIVLEHLIQASDVAHTMQHWHIYIKWNERLFHEMYKAFKDGKATKNPADSWYKGELGFFDYYILPLAKKLHECEVFGVSSDEFLIYATNNRSEWELKGKEILAGYIEKYCQETTTPKPEEGDRFCTERMFM